MNPMLALFLAEAQEYTHKIGSRLMQLEAQPANEELLSEVFRIVHTLKGNSGLFAFTQMTEMLHAAEDLLSLVRSGAIPYSQALADPLLECMDLVSALCEDIAKTESIPATRNPACNVMAQALRALIPAAPGIQTPGGAGQARGRSLAAESSKSAGDAALRDLPEAIRMEAVRRAQDAEDLFWITYTPPPDCFFQGDDPFKEALQTPGALWGRALPAQELPPLAELDTYRCLLQFKILAAASRPELEEHFSYVLEQVAIVAVDASALITPVRGPSPGALSHLPAASRAPSKLAPIGEQIAMFGELWSAQEQILRLEDRPAGWEGRVKAAATTLQNLALTAGDQAASGAVAPALEAALRSSSPAPLLRWLENHGFLAARFATLAESGSPAAEVPVDASQPPQSSAAGEEPVRFGRRAEDATSTQFLKVHQTKVDRLMNLIGELIIAKNALPYLAQRAETHVDAREIARGIKAQHAIIDRLADEMEDSIMQIRMVAVSVVFQRFHRLVRDISRKLGKEVRLVLEGEETEADKNIIESLADPLVHIVRNSLDHGIELPDVRRALGKPPAGTLTIRALQQGERVVIEIVDDGKGIDPEVVKNKAHEKGLISAERMREMSAQEAIDLIFAAGFSTAEVVSDLSGRGVGMDVVRSAVAAVDGVVSVESTAGVGTTLRISLPLSMAVSQIMVVESDGQLFGVPMDHVVETVRIPRNSVCMIKQAATAVLRGRIVPLQPLNRALGIDAAPAVNQDDELAVLLVQAGGELLGLLVDGFREALGIVQKPLSGVLSGLVSFSGSTLLGDGSVLLILNVRELF